MCEVQDIDKLQAIPILLKGDSLDFFGEYQETWKDHEAPFTMIRYWYNYWEQRARILTEWKQMRLLEEKDKRPVERKFALFRWFVKRLITLKKQLESKYKGDVYLVDRILSALDILEVKALLK